MKKQIPELYLTLLERREHNIYNPKKKICQPWNRRQMCTRKEQTEARPSSQDLKYSTAHRKSVQKQNYPKNQASFINRVVWSGDSHHIEYRAPLTFTNE